MIRFSTGLTRPGGFGLLCGARRIPLHMAQQSSPISLRDFGGLLKKLEEPPALFSGLSLSGSAIPNNIVFFQRTDPAVLRSVVGVSSNYHHRFELVVVFQSGGQATVGEKTFEICPGECVLLFPHQFHRFENTGDRAIKWLFITFELQEGHSLSPLRDRPVVLDAKARLLLKRLLSVRVSAGDAGCDALELVYTFSQFLRHLLKCRPIKASRWHSSQADDSNALILEKVNHIVRSDLSRNPRITELAARTGYSASHLRFVFRNKLGISLGKYLRESRLAEAAKLLQRTDLQVTEIAKKAGFDSLVAFSRAFKKAYNLSPVAYSKLVRRGELPALKRRPEW